MLIKIFLHPKKHPKYTNAPRPAGSILSTQQGATQHEEAF